MEGEKTGIDTNISQPVLGYVPLAFLSDENQQKILIFQENLKNRFPGVIWNTPPSMLHITLLDWLAPLVEYGNDKDVLFQAIFPQYDAVLQEILQGIKKISISFKILRVKPNAIFLVGEDSGQMQSIRNKFLEQITLLPNTKKPPEIIHSTIARFLKEYNLQEVVDFVQEQKLEFSETVTEFCLLRVSTMYQIGEKQIIKKYPLKG